MAIMKFKKKKKKKKKSVLGSHLLGFERLMHKLMAPVVCLFRQFFGDCMGFCNHLVDYQMEGKSPLLRACSTCKYSSPGILFFLRENCSCYGADSFGSESTRTAFQVLVVWTIALHMVCECIFLCPSLFTPHSGALIVRASRWHVKVRSGPPGGLCKHRQMCL
eukprot:jgi/Botrbrau1/15176/Bobra.0149s0041.1